MENRKKGNSRIPEMRPRSATGGFCTGTTKTADMYSVSRALGANLASRIGLRKSMERDLPKSKERDLPKSMERDLPKSMERDLS